ncbi:hypothetical protein H310_13790 [Aphanomyces invadans]|uniref:Fibrous sheath-interacting protein 1 n=1 Tax=Aphanomyces invadans TaxID=157072 RepID=A0A024TDP8_9STRA|nr:hypothetical protein H310_13790 [Aphanomyces invadans]ETV91721.1 hypothetical protein H310_13790 [Aphanomyces invadans]|eukprot:XP_008879647.1 hypothetical protein H310_13790 [Aphanomyces invadans]
MIDDTQQRRPRSEGHLVARSATRQPSSPMHRPKTTPKLRIQRVLSQSSLPSKVSTTGGSSELFCMTKLSDSPPKPPALENDGDSPTSDNNSNDDVCVTARESDVDIASPPAMLSSGTDQDGTGDSPPGGAPARCQIQPRQCSSYDMAPPPVSTPPTHMNAAAESTSDQGMPEAPVAMPEAPVELPPTDESCDAERPSNGMHAKWCDQMEKAQTMRDKMQSDLAEYLASLATKHDDDGSSLVTFPDNYDTVLNLMTKADLAPAAPTWSKALLQDGLTKKQAHGVIPGEAADGEGDLNIKIAHGIALIRQLDAKLDDLDQKLNKPTRTKQFMAAPAVPPKKTTSAQRIKDKVEAAKTLGDAPDFISRNKEMKEAGTSLTKSEATRVEALLGHGEAITDELAEAASNPFDVVHNDHVDRIEESLRELQAKRATTPVDGVMTFGSVASVVPLLAGMPSMAHLNATQRLAAIDCALLSFRDEDAIGVMASGVDDDAKSVRSEVSRSSSVWSRASTRTVSKRDIQSIAAQAKLEIPDAEKAPRDAINQLLATLSGITIELADDEVCDEHPQENESNPSPPHRPPEDEPATEKSSRGLSQHGRKRPTKPTTLQASATSSFSHLFTLPFEPAGPSRKQLAHTNFR